jgi:hypothetical protein
MTQHLFGFRFSSLRPILLATATMVLALSVGLARPTQAATRFVATSGTDGGNTCFSPASPCKTITHGLTQAAPGDTILVAAGTYNLALGETFPLTISTNLTLTGAGAGSTTIDATGANTRVITVNSGVTATISVVTITGGAVGCTSSGDTGCEIGGGGLGNFGILTLTNSTVSGNMASCTNTGSACNAFGGGLRNDGTLTVTNATVTANTVTCSGAGCTAEGGGPWNEGTLTVTASTVSGNTVSCNASGSDSCSAPGGGFFNGFGGTLTVTASTVSGNTANCTTSGSGSCSAGGGGLLNASNTSTTLTVTNSTVSGNTASCTATGSGPCSALGGGLANARTLTVTNATVTANTVTCSGAGCTAAGGGLNNAAGTTTLLNTIVAKQLAGPDCAGTLTSNGFNLASDNTCQLTQPSDKPNVSNPLLGPLQNNGGPTQTHALLPSSPAIDAVTSGCPPPATDQRGVARPQGAACDIGAYELETPTLIGLATRGLVQTGANVFIGGFIIGGTTSKTVLVRAIGPSMGLPPFNVPGVLANPTVTLFQGPFAIALNDDWQVVDPFCSSKGFFVCGGPADIAAAGAPSDPLESAVLITLPPGPYTVMVTGVGGTNGVGLVEVYEVAGDPHVSPLTGLATRGLVQTGGNVLIGGFIIGGTTPKTVVVRALGPSMGLPPFNVPGVLANPTLTLFSGSTAIAQNDDWGTVDPLCASTGNLCGTPAQIAAAGAPSDPLEAALLITLPPGPYTAIVSGVGGSTGVGLVEVYEVP